MPREFCHRCRRPRDYCLCPSLPPMETRTRIVLLMHPMEWKREKCTTGRITCLNLANSEIIPGLAFDDHPRVRALIDDPANLPMLLYPGEGATDLSEEGFPAGRLGGRRLVVFLIDSTWACARAVAKASPGLLTLPRLKFTPREKSRWVIKRQPADYCLSTLEAVHELLLSLEEAGIEEYEDKSRLLDVFAAMQAAQVEAKERAPRPRHFSRRAGRALGAEEEGRVAGGEDGGSPAEDGGDRRA
ncbi:MAG: DTW domain-containing protein [Spirochaetaceae bacterium]|nr:DTW domain-containing protein [Spirochaetaceae bacterium]